MLICLGNIEDIVDWFHHQSKYAFAMFFASGDTYSSRLLEDVFDARESIDILSGLRIVVFLFSGADHSAIEYRTDGALKILPGRILDRIAEYTSVEGEDEKFRTIHISDIYSDKVKRQVTHQSSLATHALVDYYHLEVSELPCILVVGRNEPEPYVIRTAGAADVEAVLSLLRDVQKISLPHVSLPLSQKKDASHRLHGAKETLQKTQRRLELAVDACKALLEKRGIPKKIIDLVIQSDDPRDFYALSRLKEIPEAILPYENQLRLVAESSEYRKAAVLVEKKLRYRDSAITTFKEAQKRLIEYEKLLTEADAALSSIEDVQRDLQMLANRYERRFAIKNSVTRLKHFLGTMINFQEKTRELYKTRREIVELMGDPMKQEKNNHYDVAISFAGEDRPYAQKLAESLREKNVTVFYDRFEQDDLWGKNLYDHLSMIYKDSARYCVMFLSESYASKSWTNLERKNAQARAFEENREYILPIKIDDTEIPGLPRTIGYMDVRTHSIEEIVSALMNKLNA
jgi:hypothetical protein